MNVALGEMLQLVADLLRLKDAPEMSPASRRLIDVMVRECERKRCRRPRLRRRAAARGAVVVVLVAVVLVACACV